MLRSSRLSFFVIKGLNVQPLDYYSPPLNYFTSTSPESNPKSRPTSRAEPGELEALCTNKNWNFNEPCHQNQEP